MGACALYTAVPDLGLVEDVLGCTRTYAAEEAAAVAARGWHRFGLGRLAVMALAEAFMPASHRELARALVAKHCYGAFAPTLANAPSFPDELRRFVGVNPTTPLWPESPLLAAIIGSAPARYVGWHRESTNGVSVLDREVVAAASDALAAQDFAALAADDFLKTRDVALMLLTWLRETRDRGDAIVLHWQLG
jgi:hypothetical protein